MTFILCVYDRKFDKTFDQFKIVLSFLNWQGFDTNISASEIVQDRIILDMMEGHERKLFVFLVQVYMN